MWRSALFSLSVLAIAAIAPNIYAQDLDESAPPAASTPGIPTPEPVLNETPNTDIGEAVDDAMTEPAGSKEVTSAPAEQQARNDRWAGGRHNKKAKVSKKKSKKKRDPASAKEKKKKKKAGGKNKKNKKKRRH